MPGTRPGDVTTVTVLITANVTNATSRLLNCTPLWDSAAISHCLFKVTVNVYVVSALCVLGIIANVLSAIVLRRAKAMRSTTRYLLQMLAVCDSLYLVTCLGHQTLGTLEECTSWGRSTLDLVWAYAKSPTYTLSNVAQTVSVWLVVCVTADRWLTVTYSLQAARLSTVARARWVVIAVWLAAIVYNLPRLFERQVTREYDEEENRMRWSAQMTAVRVHPVYVVLYDTVLFFLLRFLLPLLLLTFFNVRLLCTVRRSRRLAHTLAASRTPPDHAHKRANRFTGSRGGGNSERTLVQQPNHQQQQQRPLCDNCKQSQQQQQQQLKQRCATNDDAECQQHQYQCCSDLACQQLQPPGLATDNESLQLLQLEQRQQKHSYFNDNSDSEHIQHITVQGLHHSLRDSTMCSSQKDERHQQQCKLDNSRQQQCSGDNSRPCLHSHSACDAHSDRTEQRLPPTPSNSESTPVQHYNQPACDNNCSENNHLSQLQHQLQVRGGQTRSNQPHQQHQQQQQQQQQCGGQTQMLVVVVVVFFVCELPDFLLRTYLSVYAVRSVFDPGFKDVYTECHVPLLRYVNVLSNFMLTINSSVNFVIYVFISRHFRLVMVALLLGHKHKLRELVAHIN